MNASWIEPPPPQRSSGCFGKGCLILFAFFLILIVAFAGGTFFAVRYLRTSYFPETRVQVPPAPSTEEEQQVARARWHSFERAARARTPAQIEMTAAELNALIEAEPELRGKAFVVIEENVARLQVSIPLDNVPLLRGHFVNGECTVQAAPSGNPADARITGVVINGKAVGENALNWRGPWALRRYIDDWVEENDLKRFEIANGKVILETRGSE